MVGMKNLCFIIKICLSLFLNSQGQTAINSCWNPSMGVEVTCLSPNNLYCVTNFTSGVGSCEASVSDPGLLFCQTDNCNKIVTQCYNPANRTRKSNGYISCDSTGANEYCQLSFAGPLINFEQLKSATGSCQTTCTPSNTNDLAVTICCLGQNNCNNLFGFGGHHHGGHSSEHGVSNFRSGRRQSRG